MELRDRLGGGEVLMSVELLERPKAITTGTVVSAIEVEQLCKRFDALEAVKGISFTVGTRETFGFLGPNGAGKSTTINMLCTLARPTSGTARVAGFDVVRQQAAVRRRIGLVFQDQTLDEYLTAEENLRFHAELYSVPRSEISVRIRQMLEMVELWDRRDHIVRTFSGGMRRRLEIARGLLHSPRVLFLDEPTIGLDPQTRSHIWQYVQDLKRHEDITIFLTTHSMDEAEYCDRIAIMDSGRLVALDSPAALKAAVAEDRVVLQTEDAGATVAELRSIFGIDARDGDGSVEFQVARGEEFVPRLFRGLTVPIRSVSVSRPTLDDVFLHFTGRSIRDTEASSAEQFRGTARRWHGRRA
jgi:ABC-2 type transport system ATP-binding protein